MSEKGSEQDRLHRPGTRIARTLMLIVLVILGSTALVNFLGTVLGSAEGAIAAVLGGIPKD